MANTAQPAMEPTAFAAERRLATLNREAPPGAPRRKTGSGARPAQR